jgi:hypothetical protein
MSMSKKKRQLTQAVNISYVCVQKSVCFVTDSSVSIKNNSYKHAKGVARYFAIFDLNSVWNITKRNNEITYS